MVRGFTSRVIACCAVSTVVFGLVSVAGPAMADSGYSRHDANFSSDHSGNDSGHHRHHDDRNAAIFVSPQGSSTNSGWSCDDATFTSINAAVAAAPIGGTVIVCEGTYKEDVLVNKALTLKSEDAFIDATGLENGIHVVASDVNVDGFRIENANGEGVLVGVDALTDAALLPAAGPVLSDVNLEGVTANNNDKGFNGTETPNCQYPGDCGGGVHLNGTTHSSVKDSTVNGNSDGVLLTDDYAPSSYNLIEGNVVDGNLSECGIVLPSHSQGAVTLDANNKVTAVNPTVGGVYGNVVRDNIADDNGTKKAPALFGGGGSGSGIGLFGSGPGSAVYNNLIVGNEASGNGLAGLAMHAHKPGGEDIDGNAIVHNDFGNNNVGGDGFDGGPTDFQTTGIAIYSAVPANMVISHNTIHDDSIGIWLSTTINAQGLNHNHFDNVTTPVVVG